MIRKVNGKKIEIANTSKERKKERKKEKCKYRKEIKI